MTSEPTNEEVIKSLKDIKAYKTDIEFLIKNSRDEERENAIQYYKKEVGGKISFGEDRSKLYKDNMILVKDNVSSKEYIIEKAMNDVYSISFLNKLLSYPINNEGLQEGQEAYSWTDYQIFIILSSSDRLPGIT